MLLVVTLWAQPTRALSDEAQKMTIGALAEKCAMADAASVAFCNGLVNGILNRLQSNGLYLNASALRNVAISDEARGILKALATACGTIDPDAALMAFINGRRSIPSFAIGTASLALRQPLVRPGPATEGTEARSWFLLFATLSPIDL
jgi:hypothetical protein